MASMHISLPDPMRDWVEKQTQSGRYDNASEYVRDLIRHDQDKAVKPSDRVACHPADLPQEMLDELDASIERDEAAGIQAWDMPVVKF
ncbi:MAG: type II toxin-antitoxin system ParD family antitoxin [Parvularcula sp.]|jgi:putative addiction module CopG family antidote|nr:type II toxin-antitoxin system ParD family antitoxin [Parvularcula sp.]